MPPFLGKSFKCVEFCQEKYTFGLDFRVDRVQPSGVHIHEYSHIHSYSFTVFGGLGGVFMNPASPTEFVNISLHIHRALFTNNFVEE